MRQIVALARKWLHYKNSQNKEVPFLNSLQLLYRDSVQFEKDCIELMYFLTQKAACFSSTLDLFQ
jgi:hypothetical protein